LPKQSAVKVIAMEEILGDDVAPQQLDEPCMFMRWDTLLIAAAVAGTSMLIESSHRIDTGAPDDEVVATAPDACIEAPAATLYGWNRPTLSQSDEGVEATSDDAAVPAAPSACSDQ
jgi:hypothetical protein